MADKIDNRTTTTGSGNSLAFIVGGLVVFAVIVALFLWGNSGPQTGSTGQTNVTVEQPATNATGGGTDTTTTTGGGTDSTTTTGSGTGTSGGTTGTGSDTSGGTTGSGTGNTTGSGSGTTNQ
jgi:hypothetical protein